MEELSAISGCARLWETSTSAEKAGLKLQAAKRQFKSIVGRQNSRARGRQQHNKTKKSQKEDSKRRQRENAKRRNAAAARDWALVGQPVREMTGSTFCARGPAESDMEVLPGPSTLAGPSDLPCVFPGLCPPVFGQRAEACSVEEAGSPKEAIGSKEATGTMEAKGLEEGMGSEEGKWEFEERMFWVQDEAPIVDVTEYTFPLLVKTQADFSVTLWVCATDSISMLLMMIEERLGVPREKVKFVFAGEELDGSRNLLQCGITRWDTVKMSVSGGGAGKSFWEDEEEYQVLVKMPGNTYVTVDVRAKNTVDELKSKVMDKTGYPPDVQRLGYVGQELDGVHTLEHYKIARHCVVDLLLRVRGGMIAEEVSEMELAVADTAVTLSADPVAHTLLPQNPGESLGTPEDVEMAESSPLPLNLAVGRNPRDGIPPLKNALLGWDELAFAPSPQTMHVDVPLISHPRQGGDGQNEMFVAQGGIGLVTLNAPVIVERAVVVAGGREMDPPAQSVSPGFTPQPILHL